MMQAKKNYKFLKAELIAWALKTLDKLSKKNSSHIIYPTQNDRYYIGQNNKILPE